jgi:hypothetical protein
MTQILLSLLTLTAAAVVVFSSFCRLQIMSAKTSKHGARVAFWLLCSTGIAVIFAVLGYAWKPDLLHFSALASMAVLQIVSKESWSKGVPGHYRKKRARPA